MQIKNPTKEKIEGVQIGENIYTIEAEGTLENVPESDARYWQENLHKFLILRKDKLEDVKVETVEIPTPKVEEVTVEEKIEVEGNVSLGETNPSAELEVSPIVKGKKTNKKK